MTERQKRQGWGKRTFTPEQWLKRDIRSAATRSKKKGVKVSLAKLDLPASGEDQKR